MKHIAQQFEIKWADPEPFKLEMKWVDVEPKPEDIQPQEQPGLFDEPT